MSILSQKTENTIEAYIGAILKNSTSARPAWNVESAVTGKPPAWNYIDGVFITSLLSLYGQTRQNEFAAFAQGFTDNYIADDGAILGYTEDEYNIDHISFGRVLFDLYDLYKKEKYRKAIECLYAQLMNHPRTEKGSFWHK
ncbi:MAG: glycoside hydrolase family 88 protein, partial [Clostridiales bacterium]|nr:glycoside hydrolase family 88 protein [Clostridiales bacterium]